MARSLYLALYVIVAILSGCGTTAIVDRTASPPEADESIVVFRVSASNYRLIFFPGTVQRGTFVQDLLGNAVIAGLPLDGYLVARVKAKQTVGLIRIIDTQPASVFDRTMFALCGGGPMPVFEVPESQAVYYVIDIEIVRAGTQMSLQYGTHLENAAAHLRHYYPNIRLTPQSLPVQLVIPPFSVAVRSRSTRPWPAAVSG